MAWTSQAVVACCLFAVAECISNAETTLFDKLFRTGYNPKLRPRWSTKDPVNIDIEYELNTIGGVVEVDQVMYTVGFLSLEWEDEFLKWNPDDYNDIEHLVVPPYEVWLPDLGIANSADTFYHESFARDFRVDVKYTGRVLWEFGGNFATSCTLDMTYYPFDIQKCDLIIRNWAYSMDMVNLINASPTMRLFDFSVNGEWDLEKTEVTTSTYTLDTHPGKQFPQVTFSMYLNRKFTYYFFNIITPCLYCVFIAIMVFWLPPESGEKVSLGVTVLLAFSVFQLVVADNTPRTSDFTPLLSQLMTAVMAMTTVSVLTAIVVLYFHHHSAATRPPRWLRKLAFRGLACLLCLRSEMPDDNEVAPNEPAEEETLTVTSDVDEVKKTPGEQSELDQIRQLLKYIVDDMKQKQKDSKVQDEWRALAMVMDRLFFWFTLITAIIILPVFLVQQDTSVE